MSRRYDVVVVGGGAMGSAAAWRLAARGVGVCVLERYARGHALGSSHGASRVTRQAYFEHPDYVPLLRRSYALFEELEAETGRPLVLRCGVLVAGPADGAVVPGCRGAAEAHGIPHEVLTPREVTARFPVFRLPPDHLAVWEPGGGVVRPEATVLAQLALAERHGATVREGVGVQGWGRAADGWAVWTDAGTVLARELVVCAGPWSTFPGLRVTRQPFLWTAPAHPEFFTAPAFPAWLIERRAGAPVYGLPVADGLDGPRGVKIAIHGDGRATDPDAVDRVVTPAERDAIVDAAAAVLPGLRAPVLDARVCLYTNSPDGHFVVDRVDDLVVAAGFSGHGFKFAPVIGEALADLAVAGRTTLPIGLFSSSRAALRAP